VIVRRCSNGAEDKTLTAKPSQAKCTLRYVNTPVSFQWPRCRLWVRLGRADHLPGSVMRGRCSPVSGPMRGGRIEAALGQKQSFQHLRCSPSETGLRRHWHMAVKEIVLFWAQTVSQAAARADSAALRHGLGSRPQQGGKDRCPKKRSNSCRKSPASPRRRHIRRRALASTFGSPRPSTACK
jgi:hypothetical protein